MPERYAEIYGVTMWIMSCSACGEQGNLFLDGFPRSRAVAELKAHNADPWHKREVARLRRERRDA